MDIKPEIPENLQIESFEIRSEGNEYIIHYKTTSGRYDYEPVERLLREIRGIKTAFGIAAGYTELDGVFIPHYTPGSKPGENNLADYEYLIDLQERIEEELARAKFENKQEPAEEAPEPADPPREESDMIGNYAKRFLKYKGGADGINDLKRGKKLTTELREYLLVHNSRSYIQNYTNGIGGLADAVRKRIDLMLK